MGEEPIEMTHAETLGEGTTAPPADDESRMRANIEQTRAEMSETIDAIQDRLSPQRLVADAKDTVREATVGRVKAMVTTATETASDLTGQVQERAQQAVHYVRGNPMPAMLIGAGVAWLLMRRRDTGDTHGSGRKAYNQRPRTVGDAAERLQEGWQRSSERASTTFERWMRENPLTLAAAAVALGAVAGLSAPRTETEDTWMGDARDTLMERAQDAAQSTVQQVEKIAEQVQQNAGDVSQEIGGSPAQ